MKRAISNSFSRVLSLFPDKPPVDDRLAAFADSLRSAETPAELVLGTQVLLEGFAHCLFAEGARLGRRVTTRAIRMPGTEGAIAFLDALDRYVGKDETRHVASGSSICGTSSGAYRRKAVAASNAWSRIGRRCSIQSLSGSGPRSAGSESRARSCWSRCVASVRPICGRSASLEQARTARAGATTARAGVRSPRSDRARAAPLGPGAPRLQLQRAAPGPGWRAPMPGARAAAGTTPRSRR